MCELHATRPLTNRPSSSSSVFSQEHRRADLRDADGRVPVPGRQQAGDLPEHLPGQRGLLSGRVRRSLRPRRRLHPLAAGEEPAVRRTFRMTLHIFFIWVISWLFG